MPDNSDPAHQHLPVFIVGMTRSGSTLLLRLLASHSALVGTGETFILKRYSTRQVDLDDFVRSVTRSDEEYAIAEKHLSAVFGQARLSEVDPYRLLDEYCRSFCMHFNRAGYVEKTNVNSFFMEGLLKHIPSSKIIVSMRDPRAILASKLNANKVCRGKRFHLPRRLQFCLNLSEIIFTYKAQKQFYSDQYSDRVLFIKYEDLVLNSEATVRTLFSFLNLPYEPVHENIQPLDLSIAKRSFADLMNSSFGKKRLSGISPDSLNRWKSCFFQNEIQFVEGCFSEPVGGYISELYPDFSKEAKGLKSRAMELLSTVDCEGYLLKNIKTPSLMKW